MEQEDSVSNFRRCGCINAAMFNCLLCNPQLVTGGDSESIFMTLEVGSRYIEGATIQFKREPLDFQFKVGSTQIVTEKSVPGLSIYKKSNIYRKNTCKHWNKNKIRQFETIGTRLVKRKRLERLTKNLKKI